nr:hypothetical protein [Sicyoidochytrium minutum DNA virus]
MVNGLSLLCTKFPSFVFLW